MTSLAISPSWIAHRASFGKHAPVVGLRPRDVHEVHQRGIRPRGRARGAARGTGGSRGRTLRRPEPARAPPRPPSRSLRSPRRSPRPRHGGTPRRPSACTPAPTANAERTRASGSRSRCSTSRTPADRARRDEACTGSRHGPSRRTSRRRRRRSSSVIALAIQVTSWYCTRLRSAVTSPPPPRFAVLVPSLARPYETGPLFETTISLRRTSVLRLRRRPGSRRPRCRCRANGSSARASRAASAASRNAAARTPCRGAHASAPQRGCA